MAANLFQNAIDQRQRPMRESALPGRRLGPDGEEFRGQVAAPRGVEIQMARAKLVDEAPGRIDKALRSVCVRVDDERGGMNIGSVRWGCLSHRGVFLVVHVHSSWSLVGYLPHKLQALFEIEVCMQSEGGRQSGCEQPAARTRSLM